MINGSRFNAAGFNAGTSSLVLVSAAVAFTAGATTDFSGGGFVYSSGADFVSTNQTLSIEGSKTTHLSLDLVTSSDNYFNATALFTSDGDWVVQSSHEFDSILTAQSSAEFDQSSLFSISTQFRNAEITLISNGSTFTGIGNRIDFAEVDYVSQGYLVNDLEPQIDGAMVAAWVSTTDLWTEATHDRNLGYIEHDSYGFITVNADWATTGFLTAIFTTGGFIGSNAVLDASAIRITKAKNTVWPGTAELTASANINHAVSSALVASSQVEISGIRITHGNSNNWAARGIVLPSKALMKYRSQSSMVTASSMTGTTKMKRAGRAQWADTATFDFDEPIIWHRGLASFTHVATTSMKAHRLFSAVMGLSNQADLTSIAKRDAFGAMDMSGLGATVTIAARLKLLPASLKRTFIIPAQNRTFIVAGTDNKLKVAS